MTSVEQSGARIANGQAMAAYLAAAIGAFAMGFFVIVNEAGVFSAPALYGPAGGVSGRTTFAAVAWLIAWAFLHVRWRDREIDAGRVLGVSLALIALGVLLCFPPVWGLFG